MQLEEQVVNKILKEAGIIKEAKIFPIGDKVVLVDQVQGLNKGSVFKVVALPEPGMITIADFDQSDDSDETGEERGTYESSRFVRWNDEY